MGVMAASALGVVASGLSLQHMALLEPRDGVRAISRIEDRGVSGDLPRHPRWRWCCAATGHWCSARSRARRCRRRWPGRRARSARRGGRGSQPGAAMAGGGASTDRVQPVQLPGPQRRHADRRARGGGGAGRRGCTIRGSD
ncbi:hypothetical protein AB5I41_27970 [Sphingomonas sp. MMS24-JH45]